MEVKLLLQHGSNIYDVTPILEGGVEWFASIKGKAGRLKFKVVRDGIVNFVEGDKVTLYVNGMSRFSGFVMTKERTSEQIISVTAYDQMFYLTRNKGTYVFVNKSAKEVVQTIGADYGLSVGYISDSGWKMPQRIEEGETLVDIILSALEICGQVESVLHSLNNCILFLITPNNRAFRETGLLYRSDGTLGVFNSVFHAVDINKMVHCRNRNTIVLSALNVFQKLVINTVSVTVHPPASTGNDKIDFTRSLYLRPINVMLLATKVNSLHDNVPPSLLVHQSVPKLFSDRFLLC